MPRFFLHPTQSNFILLAWGLSLGLSLNAPLLAETNSLGAESANSEKEKDQPLLPDPSAWMVRLIKAKGTPEAGYFCNGTLIAPDLVLTAATCLFKVDRFLEGSAPRDFYAVSGTRALIDLDPLDRYEIESIINYADPGEFYKLFDIALLRLSRPVNKKSIALHTDSWRPPFATLIGRNVTEEINFRPGVVVSIADRHDCEKIKRSKGEKIHRTYSDALCTYDLRSDDKKTSKSNKLERGVLGGSPLIYFNHINNQWTQIGILTDEFVRKSLFSLDGYVDVSSFKYFISKHTTRNKGEKI